MPENGEEKSSVAGAHNSSPEKGSVPASSSSLDVEIRTMASDIEMLGRAGGALPLPEKVWFRRNDASGKAALSGHGAANNAEQSATAVQGTHSKKIIFLAIGIVAGIGALFLLGFFLPPLFLE